MFCSATFTSGCTGDGGGAFDLGEDVWAARQQVLSVQPLGKIGAVELDLPFDSSVVDPSSISVSILDPGKAPADTYLEFSVKEIGSVVKVGLINGHEDGLNGQGFQLKVSYQVFFRQPDSKGFTEPPGTVKALDTDFHSRPDDVQCSWQE